MAEEPPGGGDRTEAPTPKRLADAARDGDRLQSRELAVALVVAAGLGLILLLAGILMEAMGTMLREGLRFDRADLEQPALAARLVRLLWPLGWPFALLLGVTLVATLAAPALLGSLAPSWKALNFKANRISPIAGFKRMFGLHGLAELAKSIAKVLLVGGVGLWVLLAAWPELSQLGMRGPHSAAQALGDVFARLIWVMLGALALIALIDVPLSYFQRMKRLKMSHQEIRDEHKESEGSPEMKMARRARAYAILSQSARKGVAEAQLVLVNPSHFAVALRYQPGSDAAPVVVARGADTLAFAIRTLADGAQVPVLQLPALTRAIYFTSREGQMIDERLYLAVATIIAFVMRLDAAMRRQPGAMATLPAVHIPDDLRFDGEGRREQ